MLASGGRQTVQAALPDDEIAMGIDAQLLLDDAVTAHSVDVTVDQGIVTLTGTVDNLLAAGRAARIAASVRDVRAVVNRIATVTAERSTEEIREDILHVLVFDPAVDAGEVEIDVDGSRVVLRGTVDSWQEKRLASLAVKKVPGIETLENQLTVAKTPRRDDEDIAAEIEARLVWDVWVEASAVDVSVNSGRVRLEGTVASLAEKQRAAENAWVRGVRAVDAEALKVDWLSHRRYRRANPSQTYDDQDVARAVKQAFRLDPRVPADAIEVHVRKGVATLRGRVEVLAAAQAAADDAANTVGVHMVRNFIKTRPASGPTYRPVADIDSELERQVRFALLLEPQIRQDLVSVTVSNGLALLKGQVLSAYARERATTVASGIRGIMAVVNNLELAVPRAPATREDWQITQDIRDEIRWSPYVDGDMVAVTVDDGVALLTGVVEDLRARRAATINAFDGGALKVRNHLRVRHGPNYLRP
jgi:osmotically-inducible protein OsmY